MFDHAQWFLASMSISLSVQLSQPVAAVVSAGKTVQTAQTNSNEAAETAIEEGIQLYNQGTAEAKRGTITKWEEALKLYRQAGHTLWEAVSLLGLSTVYSELGEKQKALEYFGQSLPLSRAVGDRFLEAIILSNTSTIYLELGEKQKALEYFGQSLPLFRAVGDRRGEAVTLNNIGRVYSELGEKQKALEYYNQSLTLRRAMGNRFLEPTILGNIGRVYSELGEKQKALEYYNQSLLLTWAMGDHNGEALTLSNMAFVKRELGNLTEALNDIEASIKIIENFRNQRATSKFGISDLSTSYLATVQDYYEFYIDLLMQLHQANPNSGYAVKALEARKRAINP